MVFGCKWEILLEIYCFSWLKLSRKCGGGVLSEMEITNLMNEIATKWKRSEFWKWICWLFVEICFCWCRRINLSVRGWKYSKIDSDSWWWFLDVYFYWFMYNFYWRRKRKISDLFLSPTFLLLGTSNNYYGSRNSFSNFGQLDYFGRTSKSGRGQIWRIFFSKNQEKTIIR